MLKRDSPTLKGTKKLRLFNGRIIIRGQQGHGYIAAYSKADAVRILDQCAGGRGNRSEIDVYWNHDAWGDAMQGITPERGLWVILGESWVRGKKPERIL